MSESKRALITGITGQDGSYLAEYLLGCGYEVHGLLRRSSTLNVGRVSHLQERIQLHYSDLTDSMSLQRVLQLCEPHEVYNLAAQSHVKVSFDQPIYTGDATALGVTRLLEAVRMIVPEARFYQASSSEMFGKVREVPQTELTPFHPRSPYAVAKVYGYWATVNYREAHNLFACNGILFNHESPRRGEDFVTRKITCAVARIAAGKQRELVLGNTEARRDWGYAGDYVELMWRMLQQETPDDYVVATNEQWSVQQFVERAFELAGLDWRQYVRTDPRYFRPAEVDELIGNPAKAREQLGWQPRVRFDGLVRLMLAADLVANGVMPEFDWPEVEDIGLYAAPGFKLLRPAR
ncbi:MAG: GDP-mannose 4,6-dehydratase [Aphanocapsa lilacina HA4352-LM1]|jgi:GDPmannose 4,6-dehydratase|nr:GDP-mannose 4,6-dehydratase [Aphanocapsa lilacina HA4352-LM1]